MLKYKEVSVTFSEVPEEVTLCINLTNCPIRCPGCHSKHLWEDIGEELKPVVLSDLIAKNNGISCVAFMGGDNSPEEVYELAKWIKNNTELKVCWYSGRPTLKKDNYKYQYFDYVKIGPYIEALGGLDNPKTNQRFYKVRPVKEDGLVWYMLDDITYKFKH